MLYATAAAATFFICALTIIAQLTLLPVLFKHTNTTKRDVEERMKLFRLLADKGDIRLAEKRQKLLRRKRTVTFCPPPEPGPPGPPGDPGEDGEQGDDGSVGLPGKDALQMLNEMKQQCVICPQGERGPHGAPGNQGMQGMKGEKGVPGAPGSDGQDGEVGLEGPEGYNGTAGVRGPKGPDGKPATGGIGKPGPKGLPGPIGRTGPQGPRGKRNYVYGPPGPDGKKGTKGMDGLPGSFGPRGDRGPVGEPGANAFFCPCPLEMELLNKKNKKLPVKGLQPVSVMSGNQVAAAAVIDGVPTIIVSGNGEQKYGESIGISKPKPKPKSFGAFVPVLVSSRDVTRLQEQPLPTTDPSESDSEDEDEEEESENQLIPTTGSTALDSTNGQDKVKENSENEQNSSFEDITAVQHDQKETGNQEEWETDSSALPRGPTVEQQRTSEASPTTPNQGNEKQVVGGSAPLNDAYDDDLPISTTEQPVVTRNDKDVQQIRQVNDIAHYATIQHTVPVGNTEISVEFRDQKPLPDDKDHLASAKSEKQSSATTAAPLITGYADETTSTTHRRFIYVTKRPRARLQLRD